MLLDTDLILPGDNVFDTVLGYGEIIETSDGLATAKFGCKYKQFNSSGVMPRASIRTVFWHSPLLVHPPKDSVMWGLQKKFLDNSVEFLNAHVGAGITITPVTPDP